MIGFTDESTKEQHFVVGEFYIVEHNESEKTNGYIIKNPSTYSQYANSSESNKAVLDKLDAMKSERPFEWGVYEDWERAIDLNISVITEAVARQYAALDYILGTNKDTGTALYMLRRIENSYKRFLEIKRGGGDVAAHQYLEKYREQGLTEARMNRYYLRLLDRIKSETPLCTSFFQGGEEYKYIRKLTESRTFMRLPMIAKGKLTLDDLLTEYLKTNEPDSVALDINDSSNAIT